MLAGRTMPRTVITEIVRVGAHQHPGIPLSGERAEDLEKLRLAPVAAVRVVACVLLPRYLVRSDHHVGPASLFGEGSSVVEVSPGDGRRCGGNRYGTGAEDAVRSLGQEGRIHS